MQRLVIETLDELPAACVISRLSDFAFLCSRDGRRLHYVNPCAAEYFGWTQSEIQKFDPWWQQIVLPVSHAAIQDLQRRINGSAAAVSVDSSQADTGEYSQTDQAEESACRPVQLLCRNVGGATLGLEIHSAFPAGDCLLLLANSSDSAEAAQEILRQTQARFRSIVDSLSINLVLKDAEGCRVYANRAYLELRSLSLADILGKTDRDLFPEELAQKFADDDRSVLSTGRVIHKFEENITQDGRRIWTEIIKGPLFDADDRITGVQILFWDATDRKATEWQLEQERSLLLALLDNVPDSIYFKDRQSQFMRISRGMAKKFNLDSPEIAIGKTDADIFTGEHADRAREDELHIMETGQPIVAIVERETWPDRGDTWASTTKMPLRDSDGKIVGTFGISRDVTELIEAEQQLREARDLADQASRAKSEFLANMSHEIRTPINGIIGMAELLSHTGLSELQKSYLTMVQQSALSLLRIINDILDFSKIEAGKLDIEAVPFEIRHMIGQAAKGLALRAANKQVELRLEVEPDVPDWLRGDADRLRQILVNLVGNAIKFTEQGSITIVCKVANGPPTEALYTLHFSVADTGIGIPKTKQRTIFDAFSQADVSTTRRYGGTGLGLSISSQLVHMMEGKIWLESRLGTGSTFHFTIRLPAAQPESHSEETPRRVDSATDDAQRREKLQNIQVLVVEAATASQLPLARSLLSRGLAVEHAQDAAAAQEKLVAMRLDDCRAVALVVDQAIDGQRGQHVLLELTQLAGQRSTLIVPILLYAATNAPQQLSIDPAAKDAAAEDATVYLQKPVLGSEIIAALQARLTPKSHDSAASKSEQAQVPLRILVAEDGEVNRAVLTGLLKREGHVVEYASDGLEAVAGFENLQLDAILMDVQMPNMDGFEATEAIRKIEQHNAEGSHIPIIAVTAGAMSGDAQRCLQAGMDDYLSKPIDFPILDAILTRLLATRDAGVPFRRAANPGETIAPTVAPVPDSRTGIQVNFDAPLKKLKYSPSQHRKLIETLNHETQQRLDELTVAVERQDAKLLIRAAHSLKSAAALFEATEVERAASQVEELARVGDLSAATRSVPQLRKEAHKLQQAIQDWLLQR